MVSLRSYLPKRFRKDETVIPLVRLHGTIAAGGNQFRPSLNLAAVASQLQRAFDDKKAPVVAISVNSPGGSPVQSRLIFRRIRDLAEEKNKKVLVFVEDVAASGGYMIAVAGDEIIADPSSIVGSIGVVSASFGFTGLLEKLGVERRVYTAGKNKATLDPFKPEVPADVEHLKRLQLDIHDVFIELVKQRRGDRLTDDPDMFTGMFWSGVRGLGLGLVDELGDMHAVLRKRYGDKVKVKIVSAPRGFLGRRLPGAVAQFQGQALAAAASEGLNAVEERVLWSRFGL